MTIDPQTPITAISLRIEQLEKRVAELSLDRSAEKVAEALHLPPGSTVTGKPSENRQLAEALRQRGWTSPKIASALHASERTIARYFSQSNQSKTP